MPLWIPRSGDLDSEQKTENNPKSDQYLSNMAGDSNKGVKGSKNIIALRKKIVLYKFKTVIDYLVADSAVKEPVKIIWAFPEPYPVECSC